MSNAGRFSGIIWHHFIKEDKKGKCRYCQVKITTSAKSTGNLKRHLKSKHPSIKLEYADPTLFQASSLNSEELSENSMVVAVLKSENSPARSQSSEELTEGNMVVTMVKSENSDQADPSSSISQHSDLASSTVPFFPDQQYMTRFIEVVSRIPISKSREIDMQLLKMICKAYHHFSVLEDVEFRKLICLLCPSYSLPARKTLSNNLLPSINNELLAKIKVLLTEAQAVCFTIDGWTSINNVSFYALTAHFIDASSKLRSYLLECSEFGDKHSSENIATWIETIAKNFDVDDKICAVITDNAANMNAAVLKLNLSHIACFAHSLNSMVQSAIAESNQRLVDKARSIVQFFIQNSHASLMLQEMQVSLNKKELKLKQNVPERWNSTFDMFQRLYSNKELIISTLKQLGANVSLLEEAEWESMHHCIEMLSIFNEVIEEMSAEKYDSMSKTTILSGIMVRSVKQYLETNKMIPENVELLGSKLLEGLAERFLGREGNELISQCVLLDPRFKKHAFEDASKFTCTYQSVVQNMKLISPPAVNKTITVKTSSSLSNKSSIWDEFDASINKLQAKQDPTAAELIEELDNYLAEPYMSRIGDPLIWWQLKKCLYPTLFKIALKRLCIPATSVPCESIFSKKGQIINEKRNRLSSKKVTQFLFLNCNSDLL